MYQKYKRAAQTGLEDDDLCMIHPERLQISRPSHSESVMLQGGLLSNLFFFSLGNLINKLKDLFGVVDSWKRSSSSSFVVWRWGRGETLVTELFHSRALKSGSETESRCSCSLYLHPPLLRGAAEVGLYQNTLVLPSPPPPLFLILLQVLCTSLALCSRAFRQIRGSLVMGWWGGDLWLPFCLKRFRSAGGFFFFFNVHLRFGTLQTPSQ